MNSNTHCEWVSESVADITAAIGTHLTWQHLVSIAYFEMHVIHAASDCKLGLGSMTL